MFLDGVRGCPCMCYIVGGGLPLFFLHSSSSACTCPSHTCSVHASVSVSNREATDASGINSYTFYGNRTTKAHTYKHTFLPALAVYRALSSVQAVHRWYRQQTEPLGLERSTLHGNPSKALTHTCKSTQGNGCLGAPRSLLVANQSTGLVPLSSASLELNPQTRPSRRLTLLCKRFLRLPVLKQAGARLRQRLDVKHFAPGAPSLKHSTAAARSSRRWSKVRGHVSGFQWVWFVFTSPSFLLRRISIYLSDHPTICPGTADTDYTDTASALFCTTNYIPQRTGRRKRSVRVPLSLTLYV